MRSKAKVALLITVTCISSATQIRLRCSFSCHKEPLVGTVNDNLEEACLE